MLRSLAHRFASCIVASPYVTLSAPQRLNIVPARKFCPRPLTPTGDLEDGSPIVHEAFAKADELPQGTKKIFEVRGRKILVVNDSGKYLATNGLCSHYNFPLENGVYSNGRIRCPLHGACFNMKTGDIEDYPGFDSLHAYQVSREGDDLFIKTTEKRLSSDRRLRQVSSMKTCNDIPVIVVGSGPSAATFVEHSRLNGMITPIHMITAEQFAPYDRVLLTKNPWATGDQIRLRSDDFYKENRVTITTNTTVNSVDIRKRTISTSDGQTLPYSKLVLALGGNVRKLTVPGSHLEGVHYIRQVQEANAVGNTAAGKDVVCIGGSFIGMEIASALAGKAASVTVISTTPEPLPVFGTEIGGSIRKKFEAQGVKFINNAKVVSLEGSTSVEGVVLGDGQRVPANLVVAGIGVYPPTEWLKNKGIQLDKRGFIVVDKFFRTSADYVFAIGDAVVAPLNNWNIDSINIQHFQTAQTHGQMLGYSFTGRPHPHEVIPYFWAVFFVGQPHATGLKFVGCTEGYDEEIFEGDLDKPDWIKYYLKKGIVVAVANGGVRPAAPQFCEIFKQGIKITKDDVKKNTSGDWSSFYQHH